MHQQPVKPKMPSAEELAEEKKRKARLLRFSSASTVTAKGKITLKRQSSGEQGAGSTPVKQAKRDGASEAAAADKTKQTVSFLVQSIPNSCDPEALCDSLPFSEREKF